MRRGADVSLHISLKITTVLSIWCTISSFPARSAWGVYSFLLYITVSTLKKARRTTKCRAMAAILGRDLSCLVSIIRLGHHHDDQGQALGVDTHVALLTGHVACEVIRTLDKRVTDQVCYC